MSVFTEALFIIFVDFFEEKVTLNHMDSAF